MKVGAGSEADTTANAAYVEDSADGKSFHHKDLFPDPYLLFLLVALLFLLYSLLYLAFFAFFANLSLFTLTHPPFVFSEGDDA